MLLERFLTTVDRSSTKVAVSDGQRTLTYGQLTSFARVMRDLIVGETTQHNVGIMLPGSSAFPGVLYGCFWASRTAVPLNFLLQPHELGKIISDAGIDVVITIKHFENLLTGLDVRPIYLEQAGLKRKLLANKFRRSVPAPKVSLDDTAVILYTSGTTAEAKGVCLTYGNLMSNCRDSIAHAQFSEHHTLLSVLPPFHVFGLTALTLLPMWLGASVYYIPRFSPQLAIRAMLEQRISIMMAIPSMYAAMLRVKRAKQHLFDEIELAISGGEPLPSAVAEVFMDELGIPLCEGYGLTETSPVVSIDLPSSRRVGSVGRPIPNCEIKIVDAQGHGVGRSTTGEIWIRGPGVMSGYYNRPEQTAAAVDREGWFHSGDLGMVDDNNYVYITGRLKDMLIVGGENVYPREVEEALLTHTSVSEAAVVGQPDSNRGEVPVAFVIIKEGETVSEQALRQHCRDYLASAKVPKRVHVCSDLPRNATGKVLKRALREQLAAEDST